MLTFIAYSGLLVPTFISATSAQALPVPPQLVGTWTTKSKSTLTGSGFYDPAQEKLIEPDHTGISYSFTSDGFFEEAYYRAIANPVNPNCPKGIMQWQHGTFTYNADGSLTLTPIEVDGRQLMSDPCSSSTGFYTRYNQSETFQRFAQYDDLYYNIPRLDLYMFNGAPMNPMYQAYTSPQMLPTTTLTPPTATGAANSNSKLRKRSSLGGPGSKSKSGMSRALQHPVMDPDMWWWAGLTLTGIGGLLYFGPRRMGISI